VRTSIRLPGSHVKQSRSRARSATADRPRTRRAPHGAPPDAFAEGAIELNAEANGVYVEVLCDDLLDRPSPIAPRYDVILVGDLFYDATTAGRALGFLDRQVAVGSAVMIGDPGCAYLPRDRLLRCCEYAVPVTRDLEDQDIKRTAVWRLA
jgi:predicted nicotinamide N-methyase